MCTFPLPPGTHGLQGIVSWRLWGLSRGLDVLWWLAGILCMDLQLHSMHPWVALEVISCRKARAIGKPYKANRLMHVICCLPAWHLLSKHGSPELQK